MNRHLIAVGYGEFEFGRQRDGMIAFWSLKNPRYPHAVIPTLSGVTSVDFAISNPSLLAGAFYLTWADFSTVCILIILLYMKHDDYNSDFSIRYTPFTLTSWNID